MYRGYRGYRGYCIYIYIYIYIGIVEKQHGNYYSGVIWDLGSRPPLIFKTPYG